MASATITLGGRDFTVTTLPITQLLELAAIIEAEDLGDGLGAAIERGARIVSLALRTADASLTEANVRALAAPFGDINAAARTVLELAGLRTGEAQPVASSASSSAS
jgi:hypothetical protein